MLVSLIVKGKFHAFELAEQLYNNNKLDILISSYPKFYLKRKYGIPPSKIKSFFVLEMVRRGAKFLPKKIQRIINYYLILIFDFFASRSISLKSDIVICWSGQCLKTIKKLKENKIKVIVDRAAAHTSFQDNLITYESKKLGSSYQNNLPVYVKRVVEEYQHADIITVPSQFVKKTIEDIGIKSKFFINPLGIDIKIFKNYFNFKKLDTFTLVCVGGLSIPKGTKYVIDSFIELNLENSQLILVGTLDKFVNNYLKKYNSNKIKVVNHLNKEKLSNLLNEAHIFCNMTLQDGGPLTLLETMACGLVPISSKNCIAPDIINEGKNGYLVDIRDVESLNKIILKLYNNRILISRISDEAIKTVKNNYKVSDYFQRYQTYLKKI